MPAPIPSPPDFTVRSSSPEETAALARKLGERLRGGEIILLRGELGAGKTCFASGLAGGIETAEPAISPTYVILRSYPAARGLTLHHFDFYRLQGDGDLDALGVEECASPESVVVVEWPDRCPAAFPEFTLALELAQQGEEICELRGRWGTLPFDRSGWPA